MDIGGKDVMRTVADDARMVSGGGGNRRNRRRVVTEAEDEARARGEQEYKRSADDEPGDGRICAHGSEVAVGSPFFGAGKRGNRVGRAVSRFIANGSRSVRSGVDWCCVGEAVIRYVGLLVKIVRTTASAAKLRDAARRGSLALVPTMGALHAGHLSLIRRARKLAGDDGMVVVSIFVNPAQFWPNEDFASYPRTFAEDCRMCRQAGVDAVFAPSAQTIYPEGFSTYVNEERVSLGLCGGSRPGHFRGVCTVVLKLFNLLGPDVAVFGEKDYQQGAVIRRMVRDLNVPVRIVMSPTVREADGLALSSRNRRLTPAERLEAPLIRRALLLARDAKTGKPAELVKLARRELAKARLGKIDYVEALDAETLEAPRKGARELVVACAVFFGKTRLIDNVRRKADASGTR